MKAKLARAVIRQLELDQEASCRRSSFVGRAGCSEEDGEAVEEMAGVAGAVVAEDVERGAEDVEMRETNFQVESGVAV